MSEEVVKIAVLEQKLIEFGNIVSKIDSAIEKLSEVNTNITKMLAVHDERIEQCHKTDSILTRMIDDLKKENEKDHKEVCDRIDTIEIKIEDISRTKWMTLGVASTIAIIITAVSSFASGWWNPAASSNNNQHIHPEIIQKNK
jgi:hypothetical protein